MLLRVIGQDQTDQVNIQAVSDPSKADQCSVPNAKYLLAFADAAIRRESKEMESARGDLLNAIGWEGLVDSAGVVGNRERMNRVTLAAGLTLDPPAMILSATVRDELGLHEFESAKGATKPGRFAKLMARTATPIVFKVVSWLNRR